MSQTKSAMKDIKLKHTLRNGMFKNRQGLYMNFVHIFMRIPIVPNVGECYGEKVCPSHGGRAQVIISKEVLICKRQMLQ
jgi:hypothetical protein